MSVMPRTKGAGVRSVVMVAADEDWRGGRTDGVQPIIRAQSL
jgi:hypothetical protein